MHGHRLHHVRLRVYLVLLLGDGVFDLGVLLVAGGGGPADTNKAPDQRNDEAQGDENPQENVEDKDRGNGSINFLGGAVSLNF